MNSDRVFAAAPQLTYPRIWFWFGILLTATIFLLSVTKSPVGVNLNDGYSDKIAHAVAYAMLMGWFVQIFHHRIARLTLGALLTGMGIGLEFLQGMVPTRQFDLLDMAANTTGVLLAWALATTFLGTVLISFERIVLPHRTGAA